MAVHRTVKVKVGKTVPWSAKPFLETRPYFAGQGRGAMQFIQLGVDSSEVSHRTTKLQTENQVLLDHIVPAKSNTKV